MRQRESESGGRRASTRVLHNLPTEQTSLIGREQNLVEIGVALLDSVGRMLTLTGPGGSGKSRLALRTGRDLIAHFPDGVWLVELASLSDPLRVPESVAATLNVRERRGLPPSDGLLEALKRREMLLVLDNCERLAGACAALIELLLPGCPGLRILATSQEPLRVRGEVVWSVPPLALPVAPASSAEASMSPSVRLFVDRARSVRSTFTLDADNVRAVSEICAQVDGLPLALELAAAQVRGLGVNQIRQRLSNSMALLADDTRHTPERHKTLQAMLDWSHAGLDVVQRLFFSGLSVFAGGWTLEAAEAVCADDGLDDSQVLDLLMQLVDKSLVTVEEESATARYRFLEPIRQYAQDRLLQERDLYSARRWRHAMHFCGLAVQLESMSRGAEASTVNERRLRELANFQAAMTWAVESGEAELGLRTAAALEDTWNFGRFTEGRGWLNEFLSLAREPTSTRAKGLRAAGGIAFYQGDYSAATELLAESARLSRALGDEHGLADALDRAGLVKWARGELRTAQEDLMESLDLAHRHHARFLEARILLHLGLVACDQGDVAQGHMWHTRSLVLAEELHDVLYASRAYHGLARVARERGDVSLARSLYEAALDRRRQSGETWGIALELLELAQLRLEDGDSQRASEHLSESLPLCRELGDRTLLARAFEGTAAVVASNAQAYALQLFGAAAALRESAAAPLSTKESDLLDRRMASCRRTLGRERTLAAESAGRRMPIDDAIDLAMMLATSEVTSPPTGAKHGMGDAGLTPREAEILQLIAGGASNKEIAMQLVLSVRTVERHINNLYAKIDAHSKADATAYAFHTGLI